MRIEFTKKTIKAIKKKLNYTIKVGNVSQIMRVMAILLLATGVAIEEVARICGVTERTIYYWRNEFLCRRLNSFKITRRKGPKSRLTKEQKEYLKEMIIKGPKKAGYFQAIWTSAMIRDVIEKEFGVSYNRRYVCDILKQMGLSYQKGKFIYDKGDNSKREEWKKETWPELLKKAEEENAAILFEDEVSFSLWGSLGYTWAPAGEQPQIQTSGKRKCLKVFGVIDYFSGRFVFQREEGKLNSKSYISFLKKILKRFSGKIILIHDGAPYHTSNATKDFLAQQEDRITFKRLPSYTPEFNIIESLWKNVKTYTHNQYFPDFSSLKKSVHYVLRLFQKRATSILELCSSYQKMLNSYQPKPF